MGVYLNIELSRGLKLQSIWLYAPEIVCETSFESANNNYGETCINFFTKTLANQPTAQYVPAVS